MKLPLAVLAIASAGVLLCPSPGLAQQQGATSGATTNTGSLGATTNTSSRQTQPFQPFLPPTSPTITILGAPTVQPSPGTKQECTPVEQSIAGLIIGPTDLCDR
ncbi:MAG: hypothetical protein JOZ35_24320 [Hyphomicrobiales bacterium]|nr:hypothetical protein [Hyphomicrobiales bacterium]